MRADILPPNSAYCAAQFVTEWEQLVRAITRTVEFTTEGDASVICTVTLPGGDKLRAISKDADAAAVALLRTLNERLIDARVGARWKSSYQKLLIQAQIPKQATEAVMQIEADKSAEAPIRTKERQDTIGVSSKTSLHNSVVALAELRGDSLASVARELVTEGFEEFETRSLSESPRKLLGSYELKLNGLGGDETTQWMVRLNRHLSIRLKLTAKEYGKSASQLVAMCMTEALQKHEVLRSEAASAAEVAIARAAINDVKGPALRRLAEDIGLGKHRVLLSGVLAGKIEGPRALLQALSSKFEVSVAAISQVVSESFQSATVPAFKAGEAKPVVALAPQPWGDAVRSLGLSKEETDKLLSMRD
jgi:hypothetical protein